MRALKEPLKKLQAPIGNLFTYLLKLNLLFAFALFTWSLFATPLQLINYIDLDALMWVLGIYGGLVGTIILAWPNAKTRAGILIAMVPLAYSWHLINEFFIRNQPYEFYARIGMVGYVDLIFTSSMIILGLLVVVGVTFKKLLSRSNRTPLLPNIRETARKQGGLLVFGLTLILLCGSYVAIAGQSYPRGEVLIQPQDYQVKFAFWALGDNTTYTPAQLDALNRHNVTLVAYLAGDLTDPDTVAENRATLVTKLSWWLTNYPNVSFYIIVPGIPGGAVWDGSANLTTLQAKEIIITAHDYGLTNVKGEAFDWEHPNLGNTSTISSAPDPVRHQQAIDTWNAFFDWKAINAPEMVLSVVNNYQLIADKIDADWDLHVKEEAITFECPRWDEYAPMIYRCFYTGTKPYGDPTSVSSLAGVWDTYGFYDAMAANAKSVYSTFGNLSRLGVYIGETNCSCYGRDTQVWENGQYQGTGFDVLARDVLIAKSFGVKTVTIFLLFTAIEGGYSMGGAFDSYGDDFLDRLNTTVNGANSTRPFTIAKGPVRVQRTGLPANPSLYFMDLIYNLDHPLEFTLTITVLVGLAAGLYLVHRRRHRSTAAGLTGSSPPA